MKHKTLTTTCRLCGCARWVYRTRLDKRRDCRYSVRACAECPRIRLLAKTHAAKEQAFDLYGRQCGHCAFSDIRALQFDHTHGGGGDDRKNRSQYKYYLHIIDVFGTNKFQVLCANCNQIKRIVNGEVDKRILPRTSVEADRYYASCLATALAR